MGKLEDIEPIRAGYGTDNDYPTMRALYSIAASLKRIPDHIEKTPAPPLADRVEGVG